MPLRSHGMSPKTVQLQSIQLILVISGPSATQKITNFSSRLSVESQNVNISAGRDLIVTPVSVSEKGFGYALSVDPDQAVTLSARERIILMTPRNADSSSYYDDLSVALSRQCLGHNTGKTSNTIRRHFGYVLSPAENVSFVRNLFLIP